MSKLPNSNEFKNFQLELSKKVQFEVTKPSYNLENIYQTMKKNSIPSGRVSRLIDEEILQRFDNTQEVLKHCILFDSINDSIAIAIKKDEEIKAIAINRTTNQDGKTIKWKTLGSKSYIPHSIRDNAKVIFVLIGMKEYLLMELMNLDYIVPQSDSIVKSLGNNKQWLKEIKPKIKDKLVVYINENDTSSQELLNPLKIEHSNLVNIDINNLYLFHIIGNGGRVTALPKGYDFVDFCNSFKDIESIQFSVKEFIEMELKK